MSQNCKATLTAATVRDANNNTLYHPAGPQGYGGRGYSPPAVTTANYQQMTAKVLFSSVAAINDLSCKRAEKAEREARRTH